MTDHLTAEQTEGLLPCPFCGAEAHMRPDCTHSTGAFIGCETIGCFGYCQWEETEAEAIAAWNRRTALDALAEVEKLRSEIGRLRAIVRVNTLRHVPGVTHAEIDAILEGKQ